MLKSILLGKQNPGNKQSLRYIDGKEPPNFPVPAIRQHFEFGLEVGSYRIGTDLFDKYVVLLHCVQERY